MLIAITAAITNTSSIANPDSPRLTARLVLRSSIHFRLERQGLLVVALEIRIFHRSRVHADANDLVALLDGVAFGRDDDVITVQEERALIGAGFGLIHEPIELERNRRSFRVRRRTGRRRRLYRAGEQRLGLDRRGILDRNRGGRRVGYFEQRSRSPFDLDFSQRCQLVQTQGWIYACGIHALRHRRQERARPVTRNAVLRSLRHWPLGLT